MSEEDIYGKTIDRMEPNIASVDPGAYYASAAISLHRIANSLERIETLLKDTLIGIEMNTRPR